MKKIIRLTEEFVKECCKSNDPGHDFLHIERVRKTAKKLAKHVRADLFLVEMVALLHDVEDKKLESNRSLKDFLLTLKINEETKDKIAFIVNNISFSKQRILPEDFPIEGKIVSDADRLDAIGAIGIARAFSYGAKHNRPFYGSDDSTIKHFDEKLLILDQYLYLDESKVFAKRRMKLLNSYYKEFLKEIK